MASFLEYIHRPYGPPPVPPRPASQLYLQPPALPSSQVPGPGAIYSPGTYPTPDLPLSPLGPSIILSSPSAGYTSESILTALDALGPGGTLYLPPRTRWVIHSPILFKEYQEIATYGYPTEEGEMAMLEGAKECRPNVVSAWGISGARLRNVIVEGNMEKFGHDDESSSLVSFGENAKHQWVDRCIIRNGRQWSCLSVHEDCTDVRVTNCKIGPSGIGKDVREGNWADGISYAGSDGLVAGNEIIDCTDGGIVIFQAPGTLVTSNTIVAYSRVALGAINMVDYGPHDGEYTQTCIVHNTILTAGSYICVGIAQGPTAWGGGPGQPREGIVNKHAVVARNLIHWQDRGRGRGAIAYGFAVAADVEDWTCIENDSGPGVVYEGDMSDIEWHNEGGLSLAPGPFVRAAGPSEKLGRLQPEFVAGLLRGPLGIKPGRSNVLRLFPGQCTLRPGGVIRLKENALEFGHDGELRIRHVSSGRVLWEAGSRGCIVGREERAVLDLTPLGLFRILDMLDGQQEPRVLHDFVPHIPPTGEPTCDPDAGKLPSLRISDQEPYLGLNNAEGGSMLSSSYELRWSTEGGGPSHSWKVGDYIARPPTVAVLSPYGQYVVLAPRFGAGHAGKLEWPLDEKVWEVLWKTPNAPLIEKNDCSLEWQGDGNFVIYGPDGPLWASGTCEPPSRILRWGTGSPQEPYVELLDEHGQRLWST